MHSNTNRLGSSQLQVLQESQQTRLDSTVSPHPRLSQLEINKLRRLLNNKRDFKKPPTQKTLTLLNQLFQSDPQAAFYSLGDNVVFRKTKDDAGRTVYFPILLGYKLLVDVSRNSHVSGIFYYLVEEAGQLKVIRPLNPMAPAFKCRQHLVGGLADKFKLQDFKDEYRDRKKRKRPTKELTEIAKKIHRLKARMASPDYAQRTAALTRIVAEDSRDITANLHQHLKHFIPPHTPTLPPAIHPLAEAPDEKPLQSLGERLVVKQASVMSFEPYLTGQSVWEHKEAKAEANGYSFCEFIAMAYAMGKAIHYVHQDGLIHGDVKPGNMIIDEDRLFMHRKPIKLIDFEGSFPIDNDLADPPQWTEGYDAPEISNPGEGERPTPAIDIYAYGKSLWQLLLGDKVRKKLPPPYTLPDAFKAEPDAQVLEDFLNRMVSADPKARPTAEACVDFFGNHPMVGNAYHAELLRLRDILESTQRAYNVEYFVRKRHFDLCPNPSFEQLGHLAKIAQAAQEISVMKTQLNTHIASKAAITPLAYDTFHQRLEALINQRTFREYLPPKTQSRIKTAFNELTKRVAHWINKYLKVENDTLDRIEDKGLVNLLRPEPRKTSQWDQTISFFKHTKSAHWQEASLPEQDNQNESGFERQLRGITV